MTQNLRTLVSAIVIGACIALSVFVGNSAPSASVGKPSPLPVNCQAMQHIPSYRVTMNADGEGYTSPTGKALVKMAVKSSESRSDLRSQCRQLVLNYANDLVVIEATR
jgi:hypothetical protein